MADIICRWRNGTPKTVVELVNSLPHNRMTNEAFRQFMQHSPWGNEFFHTPYQLACQLGLYCEAEDGYYYPRFDHDISEKEAQEYLEHWMPRYYVPNPYVGRNGFNDIKCPTYVLYELYKYAAQHKNCTYKEAYEAVFQEKPTNNNDIVKNYINNYSQILRFEASGLLTITDINPNTVFDFMDRNNKKEFFDNFSKNDNAGSTQTLLVEQNKLTTFILSIIQYFNKKDGLNAIIPYAGSTSPIKVSKESVFSLVGMFLESTLDDVKARNLSHTRWFEDQFTLGRRIVFLSTQWNANGDYQLTLDDFIKMIQCCYGTDYKYKTGPNGEHQLYLVSKKANNDLKGYPRQQIFYGAPGTGKSHRIKEIIRENGIDEKEQVIRTTFHPDSDYSTFVGCYKPIMKSVPQTYVVEGNEKPVMADKDNQATKDEIVYDYTPQAFVQAYTTAWTTNKPVILVIEEINRGNCAQIFGDIFQLLDRGDDGVSEYEIKPDNALDNYLKDYFADKDDVPEDIRNGKIMKLPSNLYIWATMNTSDQSLFPIDSAFKRRWEWKYIPIDTKKESWVINVDGTNYDWSDFLEKINAKIESATSSEDKMLGFYFCKAENNIIGADRFVSKVLFYLWNDVFKDYGFDDAIFNDDNNQKLSFRKFYKADGTVDENKVKKFLDNLQVQVENERPYGEDEEMNSVPDISVKRQSFWQGFNQARSTHPEYCDIYKNPKTPREEHFMDLSFGTSAYHPFLSVLFKKKTICVGISIYGTDRNTENFEHFKENEAAINALAGVSLIFEKAQKPKNPDNPSYSIVAKKEIDINDESTWEDAYNWMMDMAVKMNEIKEKFGV